MSIMMILGTSQRVFASILESPSACLKNCFVLHCQDRRPLLEKPPGKLAKATEDAFENLVAEDGNTNDDILEAFHK